MATQRAAGSWRTFSALPAAFVGATVQLAVKWSSLRLLLVREAGISESVAKLAREVNRSLLFPISRLTTLVALISAGVLGTMVLAQQQAIRVPETTSRPSTRSAVSSQEKAANPGQPGDKIRAMSPRQQFEALLTREEDHLKKIQSKEGPLHLGRRSTGADLHNRRIQ